MDDRDSDQLKKIKMQIRRTAFKEEKFNCPKKSDEARPFSFKALTHLYILDSSHNKIRHRLDLEIKEINTPEDQLSPEEKLIQILQLKVKVEEFVGKVALEIYDCRFLKKEFIKKIAQDSMIDTRRFLESQGLSKGAVSKVVKNVKKELNIFIKDNEDCFFPQPSEKQSPSVDVKDHEDYALSEIYNFYKEFLPPLNQRKILGSMAIILAATGFWEDNLEGVEKTKLYFYRLWNRKRNKVFAQKGPLPRRYCRFSLRPRRPKTNHR